MATNRVSFFLTGLLFVGGSVPSGTTHAIMREVRRSFHMVYYSLIYTGYPLRLSHQIEQFQSGVFYIYFLRCVLPSLYILGRHPFCISGFGNKSAQMQNYFIQDSSPFHCIALVPSLYILWRKTFPISPKAHLFCPVSVTSCYHSKDNLSPESGL